MTPCSSRESLEATYLRNEVNQQVNVEHEILNTLQCLRVTFKAENDALVESVKLKRQMVGLFFYRNNGC